ncbi:hypothetical protein SAMN02745947_01608 [Rhodococcus rhodochrous J3]|uniref:DUF6049 family protein n=2 Tax=Rhodococcus rhodochrous TaxID=1829 RepID=A0AA47A609_RHORH|nr:DUF6049 family protein [Rhodococcus rhodochrous]MBF4480503.1 glycoprotein [Rhodococcus rhodochrous]MCB8911494.1 glycoprotein [Rhodococcus rhodochrous]MDJ0397668.1 DUF6049 family protein [Rhodococcus rhodochrous]TWH42005.1 hypothetical protein L612_000400000140 [Rhodococcus rhodochrous J38]UZF45129.1 DUF6049 family protein [Rhodococcus rhodochrous]
MTVVVSRAGAAVLAVLVLVLTTAGVTALLPTTLLPTATANPAAAQTDPDEPRFLELSIDEVTPQTVTLTSESVVTVRGTVANIGDRDVEDVWVRLQRAPVVSDSAALRTSLSLDQAGFDTVGEFEEVADRLGQGERADFELELPLRSELVPSLDIDTPGVYPLLVNVNGVPEYGGAARLDDARFLLPVLALPASDEVTEDAETTGDDTGETRTGNGGSRGTTRSSDDGLLDSDEKAFPAVPPDVSRPAAVTMLWPLADRPRLAAGVAGSGTEPVRLIDDDLATSLAEGGRLDGLLRAVEDTARTEPRVLEGLCLAIDPDLLVTVANMTRDYLVVEDPDEPTGDARPGSGTDAAAAWLERLRALAATTCTMAVPFAQVDLTALADLADSSLTDSALESPAAIVDSVLGVTSTPGVMWPDSGVLTEKTGSMLAADGPVTALLSDNAVEGGRTLLAGTSSTPSTAPGGNGFRISGVSGLTAVLFDSSASAALAGMGTDPQTPSFAPSSARYDLSRDSSTARLQDALGALAWPAMVPTVSEVTGAALPAAGRSVLFAPPQNWSASPDDAASVLSMLSTLVRSGLTTPRPLGALVDAAANTANDPTASLLVYPEQAITDGASAAVVSEAEEQIGRLDAIQTALVEDPQAQLTPRQFTAPLREDLLRAMSLSGRRGADADRAYATGEHRAAEVREAVDDIYDAVTVISTGGVYTLTSEQSPLLLTARNDLPVGITVRLQVDAPDTVDITDIGPTQLPPRGSRTLTVPAQISDSRNLRLEFALTTESGLPLGSSTTVTVRSNAYGQILAVVTGCAGALLLFLAGRRLLHRFRGEPDPADEGYEK